MRSKILMLVVASGLASACTSVKTLPDVHRSSRHQALAGIPYSLPMRQYGLQVTRTLVQCDDPSAERLTEQQPIKFSTKVAADPQLVAGERYVVNYAALASWVKTSDFAIETHPSGTLKTVNASADDKSDQVIKAVVKTGMTLASMGMGVPLGGGQRTFMKSGNESIAPAAQPMIVTCKQETRDALATLTAKEDALKEQKSLQADKNKTVEDLALVGAITEDQKKALLKALYEQRQQVKLLETATRDYADALDAVSVIETRFWPRDFADGGVTAETIQIGEPGREKLAALFHLVPASTETPPSDCVSIEVTVASCIEPQLLVNARIEPRMEGGDVCPDDASAFNCSRTADVRYPKPEGLLVGRARTEFLRQAAESRASRSTNSRDLWPDKGVFVRPPETGRILVCSGKTECAVGSPSMLIVGEWLPVPQLGQLRFLPFENRMFESNQLVVQLAADGTVEKFQYASKAAALQRVAEAAADAATQLKTARKDARDEITAAQAQEAAALQHQITMLTKQDELKKMENPSPAAADPMKDAQLELVRAQIQALLAQAELARRPN